MSQRAETAPIFEVEVTTHGDVPGAVEYAKKKIGSLGRFAHHPVPHARVRVTRHADPAVQKPVVAQGNLDVDGRLVRAQAQGDTAHEAIDLLAARLRSRLQRAAGRLHLRHTTPTKVFYEPWYVVPAEEPQIVRRKSFSPAACSVDEAAREMDLLDYSFHFFTEKATRVASVLYRESSGRLRLAQVVPVEPNQLAPYEIPLSFSHQPVPCLTLDDAVERIGILGQRFLFFIEAAQGRANVLYRRFDGNYGLISPSG